MPVPTAEAVFDVFAIEVVFPFGHFVLISASLLFCFSDFMPFSFLRFPASLLL